MTCEPYVQRLLEWFGPERLMFGSDWPVCHVGRAPTARSVTRPSSPSATSRTRTAVGSSAGPRPSPISWKGTRDMTAARASGTRARWGTAMNGRHFGARHPRPHDRGLPGVALENEVVRVEVLVDKGSDIISFLHKPSDTDFMWHREAGLRGRASGPNLAGHRRVRVRRPVRRRLAGMPAQRRPGRAVQGRTAALPRRAPDAGPSASTSSRTDLRSSRCASRRGRCAPPSCSRRSLTLALGRGRPRDR